MLDDRPADTPGDHRSGKCEGDLGAFIKEPARLAYPAGLCPRCPIGLKCADEPTSQTVIPYVLSSEPIRDAARSGSSNNAALSASLNTSA